MMRPSLQTVKVSSPLRLRSARGRRRSRWSARADQIGDHLREGLQRCELGCSFIGLRLLIGLHYLFGSVGFRLLLIGCALIRAGLSRGFLIIAFRSFNRGNGIGQ